MVHACDVRDPNSVNALFRAVRRQFKRIDILINNAGIAHKSLPLERLPYPVWKDVIETNLDGMFLITQGALALMKRGGTIVNNLSIAANRVFAGSAAYNASKHGALGLTNTLREELRAKGIRVIGLLPGATDTDIGVLVVEQCGAMLVLEQVERFFGIPCTHHADRPHHCCLIAGSL